MKHLVKLFMTIILSGLFLCQGFSQTSIEKILDGYTFTEGPAVSEKNVLYFSDVPEQKIYQMPVSTREVSLFLDNSGGANGLYFNQQGNLIACAGKARQVVSIAPGGAIKVIADQYNGKKLNSPNDLWIDSKGGIYFTDPRYGNKDNMEQDGMHVYYIHPEGDKVSQVINSLARPNGIIGSLDGKKLYVVDEGQRKTFVFDIAEAGKVKNKALFCEEGIDGMTVTNEGNICITVHKAVSIYSPEKVLLKKYEFEHKTTNVVYHENQLFVTTQAGEVWTIEWPGK